ncbi:MAG: hypothetical protein PVI42_07880 [Desulfobacterales bacterium]
MTHILVRHMVAVFDKCKWVYQDHRSAREAAGLTDLHLWRNEGNSSEVILLLEASDVAKEKEFASSLDAKEKMQAAGVQGLPEAAGHNYETDNNGI